MYKSLLRPLLFFASRNDPERAHDWSLALLELLGSRPCLRTLVHRRTGVTDLRLTQNLCGITFPNPVGLAAGFDKNGKAISGLAALGFGFIEMGTITPKPNRGNDRPRIQRSLNSGALINWMRFPNDGAEAVAARLENKTCSPIPLGINVGTLRPRDLNDTLADYLFCLENLFSFGDYFVLNISSPNTPHLHALHHPCRLQKVLVPVVRWWHERNEAIKGKTKPLLVKISPDLSRREINDVVSVCLASHIHGIVATNSTTQRDMTTPSAIRGGISGKPLYPTSLRVISQIRESTPDDFLLIGCGGVRDAKTASLMLQCGANLVQLYTGLAYQGPTIVRSMLTGLCRLLDSTGAENLDDLYSRPSNRSPAS